MKTRHGFLWAGPLRNYAARAIAATGTSAVVSVDASTIPI